MSGTVRILLSSHGLIMMLSMVGCGGSPGPQRVPVRGAILFKNEMLKSGRIIFIPVDASRGPTAVATITGGFYEFERGNGPVVGKNKVQIESIIDPGFELDDEAAYAKAALQQPGPSVLPAQPIPPEYNERTTLVVTVSPEGETKLDFSL